MGNNDDEIDGRKRREKSGKISSKRNLLTRFPQSEERDGIFFHRSNKKCPQSMKDEIKNFRGEIGKPCASSYSNRYIAHPDSNDDGGEEEEFAFSLVFHFRTTKEHGISHTSEQILLKASFGVNDKISLPFSNSIWDFYEWWPFQKFYWEGKLICINMYYPIYGSTCFYIVKGFRWFFSFAEALFGENVSK